MNHEKLEFIRRGGRVTRFHGGFHLLMPDKVGQHTFNLMGILLCCLSMEDISVELMVAAHEHDLPECETGDLPAPFKRSTPGLHAAVEAKERDLMDYHDCWQPKLTAQEKRWLKLADSLDGAFHCLEERRLGNTTMDKVFWTFMSYVDDLLGQVCDASVTEFSKLYDYVEQEWSKVNGNPRS